MHFRLNKENFRLLRMLLSDLDIDSVDKEKKPNQYNCAAAETASFATGIRIRYDGETGLVSIPDNLLVKEEP